ncbi:MAG: carbohydrate porin [Rhodocyclales bacterium]|nr:carbohydrate porin [Rhodocyclales bacterium]
MMRIRLIAALLAAGFAAPAAANDMAAVLAEMKRLAERVEALEKHNRELEKSLDSQRISEKEPELVTRLKAVEFQTLAMQKQARQIESLEGITVGASLTGVAQKVGAGHTASGAEEARANYRGDISVTLPGGEMGNAEGKIFAHFRFGQGTGLGLRPTYTSGANTTAFQTSAGSDDSFGILAQAWYQLKLPLMDDGIKANAREHLHLTAGKIDPFVFFDQNGAADDESAKFMNNAFVHNPLLDSGGDIRADAYGFAPGAIVKYENLRQKGSEWALSLGAFGSGPGANFSGSLAHPFVISQAETNVHLNYLPGTYRAYLWRNGRGRGATYDRIERKHAGIGFSADQKISDELTLFGRYGHQIKGKVRFDRALTVGAELAGSPWGRAADSLGLALGALRTSADFRRDSLAIDADADGNADFGYQASGSEKQLELYYRYKLNSRVELTPDFQLIRQPGGNAAAPTVKVFGLRAKVGF